MERFVVGTGRCGSTLLTRMISAHADVLGLNEFFTGLDWGRRFAPDDVTGAAFGELIATPNHVVTEVTSRGYEADEVAYPFRDDSRYARGDGVPWVLVATLPRLTDDPDALFDEMMTFVGDLPAAPLATHYCRLFDWLVARFASRAWVERSGSSIDYVGDLMTLYPGARFVHIHRDGHEAALSIRAHPFFRLAVNVLYETIPSGGDDPDPITTLLESIPPVEMFGRYWTEQLLHGFAALPRLGADQYLAVRFEDLLAEPRETLRAIGDFLELPNDTAWLERAAALVGKPPGSRFERLSADEQRQLAEACRPGQVLLGRAG